MSTSKHDHGQDNTEQQIEKGSSPSLDPFLPSAEDLTPCSRLLRLTKTGEKLPVTLRMTRQTTSVSLNLSIPPISSSKTTLYGIEYDDPSRGKHEGVYEGQQVFEPRQKGVGAGAILLSARDLRRGYTFTEALSERYDVDIPGCSRVLNHRNRVDLGEKELVLGSSGGSIKVEAPGLEQVQKRIGQLGRLQSAGLEDYHVCGLGGNEETRAFLKENLTALRTLDLSNNLIFYWEDLADIISCIPSLRKIILNNSRIETLARRTPDLQRRKETIREAFSSLTEVELCNCYVSWDDVMVIAPFLPRIQRLDLVDNPPLHRLDTMKTENGEPFLQDLVYLNLAGCGISDWKEIIPGLQQLPQLDTLDISNTPLTSIPLLGTGTAALRIPHLIMLNSRITAWSSIFYLQEWTGGTLSSLKFSLSSGVLQDGGSEHIISGEAEKDRPTFIALLPSLQTLNSTSVTTAERRDAEVYLLRRLEQSAGGDMTVALRGRYDELRLQHATEGTAVSTPPARMGPLKSKLLKLSIFTSDANDQCTFAQTVSVLPSSPISLLKRKISKLLGRDSGSILRVWTVKPWTEGEARERAVEVEEGENVGWWFSDGDEVIVEPERG